MTGAFSSTLPPKWFTLVVLTGLILACASLINVAASPDLHPRQDRAVPPPDTLRDTIPANQTAIRALPVEMGNAIVNRYQIIQAPAYGWVKGHSLLLKAKAATPGTRTFHLEARTESTTDTLVVLLTVTPKSE